jgi:broad specificity phosphatase PhoE
MELDTGCFTGLTLAEAAERHPELFAAFRTQSWAAVPDAEPPAALAARAARAWRILRQAALTRGGHVLAVTHGGLLQWLVRLSFGCHSWMPLVSTGNCGLFHLRVEPAGGQAFVQWREFNQLPPQAEPATPPVF